LGIEAQSANYQIDALQCFADEYRASRDRFKRDAGRMAGDMSANFVDPARDLQAEGNGDCMLTVCTTSHDHLRTPLGKVGQAVMMHPRRPRITL
jgi:hypothetical protein